MTYTPEKPDLAPSADELRARIPGWGSDLDHRDRPAYPKERFDPSASGAHWHFPERQPQIRPRERSIEHGMLTPVFGTAQPTKGLSGVIRRYAYRKFSEGRAAHFLLLVVGDRVDAIESHATSFLTGRPDNPISETGILSERRRRPFASRFGVRRVDLAHTWIDPILVAGPWILTGWAAISVAKRLLRK